MKRILCLGLILGTLLTGCSFLDGSYVSVVPHRAESQNLHSDTLSAGDYPSLVEALKKVIANGTEKAAILVADYPTDTLESSMSLAVNNAVKNDPLGAYAVDDISYEMGTSGGLPAVAVDITYRHSTLEMQKIRTVPDMSVADRVITTAVGECASSLVLFVENYALRDITQLVQDYAREHPDVVMEIPQVTEQLYGNDRSRVVELIFSYQNSREDLRQMKWQVKPVFDAASLYVSGDVGQMQKYAQLYSFLMERFTYQIETSITPAYSLLCHGVGDSRAFATVYASMCRTAGLECTTVVGTRAGEPHVWNMIADGETYYHLDLLQCSEQGVFHPGTDEEMSGYVWDYSAYPVCGSGLIPSAGEPTPQIAAQSEQ